MTKAEKIKEYNQINKGYNITNIKKIPIQRIDWLRVNGAKSLGDLYNSYSDAKAYSWQEILRIYKPQQIIGLQGSSMTYSVVLIAENGDTLWITRDNNYLVEATE